MVCTVERFCCFPFTSVKVADHVRAIFLPQAIAVSTSVFEKLIGTEGLGETIGCVEGKRAAQSTVVSEIEMVKFKVATVSANSILKKTGAIQVLLSAVALMVVNFFVGEISKNESRFKTWFVNESDQIKGSPLAFFKRTELPAFILT